MKFSFRVTRFFNRVNRALAILLKHIPPNSAYLLNLAEYVYTLCMMQSSIIWCRDFMTSCAFWNTALEIDWQVCWNLNWSRDLPSLNICTHRIVIWYKLLLCNYYVAHVSITFVVTASGLEFVLDQRDTTLISSKSSDFLSFQRVCLCVVHALLHVSTRLTSGNNSSSSVLRWRRALC